MKIDFSRAEAVAALNINSGFTSRVLEAWSFVRLLHEGDELSFLTNGGDGQCRTSIKSSGDTIERPVYLKLDILIGLLQRLPDDTVTLVLEDKDSGVSANLISGRRRYRVPRLKDDTGFGERRDLPMHTAIIPASALHSALKFLEPTMAEKDVRIYLNGAHIKLDKNSVFFEASDGNVGSVKSVSLEDQVPEEALGRCIIPNVMVRKIISTLAHAKAGERVHFSVLGGHFYLMMDGFTEISTSVIDGLFPALSNLIPEKSQQHITINRSAMLEALNRLRIAIGADIKYPWFEFRVKNGEMVFSHDTPHADVVEYVDFGGEMEDADEPICCMSVPLFIRTLESFAGAKVDLQFGNKNSEILRINGDDADGDSVAVCMPMRRS